MADIRAFRGTFYNPEVIEDLSKVTAPPYDVIDDRKKRTLLSRSPYNIVRLILPQPEGDTEFWNNSATLFRAWKKGGVLTSDSRASFYIYRQTFDLLGEGEVSRTGVIALLRCKEFSSGDILPHEKTFPRTRAERLNLLRACRANLSQIFTIFQDRDEEVLGLVEGATAAPPLIDISDEEGVRNQVWRLEESGPASRLEKILGNKKLLIADGHHRYETALAFSKEKHGTADAAAAAAYVSVALFRSEDPGLVVLPVHRLLRRMPLGVEESYRRLERYFHVEAMADDTARHRGMYAGMLESSHRPAFIMVSGGKAALLTLREGVEPHRILGGPGSRKWKDLHVSVLHSLIISECLGLDAEDLTEQGGLYFTPWESTALEALAAGEAEAAFFMRPTRMDEIWDIAKGGERMPHKSSYFYPKLASGLLIYDHDTAFM